jgi:hypothetical protein
MSIGCKEKDAAMRIVTGTFSHETNTFSNIPTTLEEFAPWLEGTTGINLSPLELLEKLAALVPLLRVHLVRYGGCLAPHSKLRATIIPTPRQQGIEAPEASRGAPRWTWAKLLKRVFDLDLATCPRCQRGTLRMIAAITHVKVIRKILRHLKRTPDPPLIASARCAQAAFAWAAP